jgi:hypothetical protein
VRVSFVCRHPHRLGNRLEHAEELGAALESYMWWKSFELVMILIAPAIAFKNSTLWRIGN